MCDASCEPFHNMQVGQWFSNWRHYDKIMSLRQLWSNELLLCLFCMVFEGSTHPVTLYGLTDSPFKIYTVIYSETETNKNVQLFALLYIKNGYWLINLK